MPGAVRPPASSPSARRVPARTGRTAGARRRTREAVKTVDQPTAGAGPDGPEPRLGGARARPLPARAAPRRGRASASSGSRATSAWTARSRSSGSRCTTRRPRRAPSARPSPPRGSATPGSSRCTRPAATTTRCTSSPSSSAGRRWPSSMAEGALSDRDVAADRRRAVRRAGPRPRARRRAPRRQARQRPRPRERARRRRRGQAHRLRRRAHGRRRGADAHRRRRGHAGLHGARAGGGPRGGRAGRPLRARARRSTRRSPGVNPVRAAGAAATARRVGRCGSRRCAACAATCRRALCAAVDRAVAAAPERAARWRPARGAARPRWRAATSPDGRRASRLACDAPPRCPHAGRDADLLPGERHPATSGDRARRSSGAAPAAGEPAATPLALRRRPPALAVAARLRRARRWRELRALAAAAARAAGGRRARWPRRPSAALPRLAVAGRSPLALVEPGCAAEGARRPGGRSCRSRRCRPSSCCGAAGTLWSAPAAAPLLGGVSLAGAWPALAGQAAPPVAPRRARRARRLVARAGRGAARRAARRSGRRPAPPRAATWDGSATDALRDAVAPALSGGVLVLAGVWAVAAAALPLVVRGRAFALDLVGATVWAAALALGHPGRRGRRWTRAPGPPAVRGLVAGAVAAGVVAVAARASRGEA